MRTPSAVHPVHSRRTRIPAVLAAFSALALALSGCDYINDTITSRGDEDSVSTGHPQGSATIDQDNDYFVVTGTAKREHQVQPGEISYCDLDEMERATCAYGELTYDTRADAQARGRSGEELPDPTGWPEHNAEVDIPALTGVEGSKSYHGWMFNRSHLIADSLGGEPEAVNLVTGTRTQNVGSHQKKGQYAGGMAHTELLARDYLDNAVAQSCPLYYAVTPHYESAELIPRTVTVDIQSCDKSIDERVEVSNSAQGWAIDYTTGEYSPAS